MSIKLTHLPKKEIHLGLGLNTQGIDHILI